MDKKLKAKWVKALRSGKYKQGRHRLVWDDGSMCCLGVLCDIEGTLIRGADAGRNPVGLTMDHSRRSGIWEHEEKLAEFNDIKGRSFKWIAAYIDRYL